MSDARTNSKSKTLVNFMANTPSGSMFARSIDGWRYMKTELKIFELLASFVQEIGEENVV